MIRAALSEVGAEISWTEWERADSRTPEALRRYGSPTVLVNSKDVVADENQPTRLDGKSCRVYTDEIDGFRGAPRAKMIANAIRAAMAP